MFWLRNKKIDFLVRTLNKRPENIIAETAEIGQAETGQAETGPVRTDQVDHDVGLSRTRNLKTRPEIRLRVEVVAKV